MLLNGLQNNVLTLVAVVLALVLLEGAVTTLAVITRSSGTTSMLRTATATFLSGVHFICNLESEVGSRK